MNSLKAKKILLGAAVFLMSGALGGGFAVQASPSLPLDVDYQITNNNLPTITGNIADPTADIQVTLDGEVYEGANGGDGTWAAGVTKELSDGIYDVEVVAVSPNNEKTTTTAPKSLVIDTVAPRVTVEDLTDAGADSALLGTVDDSSAAVIVGINGQSYVAKINNDNTWTLPADSFVDDLAPGTYEIDVVAGDPAGNVSDMVTVQLEVIDGSGQEGGQVSPPQNMDGENQEITEGVTSFI